MNATRETRAAGRRSASSLAEPGHPAPTGTRVRRRTGSGSPPGSSADPQGRPPRAVTDAGLTECFRLTGRARGAGGDLVPEPGRRRPGGHRPRAGGADDGELTPAEAASAKLFCTEAAHWVIDRCLHPRAGPGPGRCVAAIASSFVSKPGRSTTRRRSGGRPLDPHSPTGVSIARGPTVTRGPCLRSSSTPRPA
jgi:hypothetical protein